MSKGRGIATPILDDIQDALYVPAQLRLALDTLQSVMPPELETDGVRETLKALREKLLELELREIRRVGPQEYLLIKPLPPDIGGEFADKAAEHVRALDDLGLIIRLDL
jgi:hypothetical protein